MAYKETQYGLKGPRFNDLTGRRFDKLVVVDYVGYNGPYKTSVWLCGCDCGKTVERQTNTLMRFKNFHSCGCTGTCPVLPNQQHAFKRMFNTYKNNAKRRKIEFHLSVEEFRSLISSNCSYCGSTPKPRFENCTVDPILANGIDRIDSNIDYVSSNCVASCKNCNYAKHEMGTEQFLSWIKQVYVYNFERIFKC